MGNCYIVIYMFMQHHNDTIIKTDARRKTQEDFFNKIFTSHFIARVRKGCSRFACERELEIEHNCNILTLTLMAVTLCLSCSLDAQPEVQRPLCWVMTFFMASYQHLLRTPTRQGPNGPFGLMWLSLQHLVYNSLQLNSTGSSNSTELYNRSTPTRSLKSNV